MALPDFLPSTLSFFCAAPGIGEGSSSSETPQPPRKKRARVDPTVESVCAYDSPAGFLMGSRRAAWLRNTDSSTWSCSVNCYDFLKCEACWVA